MKIINLFTKRFLVSNKKIFQILFIFSFFLFTLFFPTNSLCEDLGTKSVLRIHSIRINGNTQISRSIILNSLGFKVGDQFSYQDFNHNLSNILEIYKKEGFFFAKILPPVITPIEAGGEINIEIMIEEGEKVIVSDLSFSGNKYFSSQKLADMISLKPGQMFSVAKINQSLKTIVRAYSQIGYPFCKTSVDTILEKNPYSLQLDFAIEEGKLMRISHFIFVGNKITKDKTLKLLLNFPTNKIYNQTEIELAQRNLLNKQYIQSANIKPINSDELLVQIKERKMNHLDGVLGFTSSEEKQTLSERLSGFIDFDFMNISGTDRDVHIVWKKLKSNSTIFNISYTEPFLFNKQISAQGLLFRKNVDTTYVNTEFEIKIKFLLANYNKIGINYLNSSSLLDTIQSDQQGIGLDFESNRFDYPPNPYSGYDLFIGSEVIWENRNSYKQKIHLEAKYSLPLTRKTTFFFHGLTKLLFTFQDSLNSYELFEFGGYDNLRGFIDNQFISEKFGILVCEYRFLISQDSRIFLFCDSAFCKEYKSIFGIGFGVRLKSKIGLLKIDYGIDHQDETWTNPLQGIIHFGIETTF